jgi:hypothetical protein
MSSGTADYTQLPPIIVGLGPPLRTPRQQSAGIARDGQETDMALMTPEQHEAAHAAGWTDDEVTSFVQAVRTFRDGLPPRQQAALNGMLAAAHATVSDGDVQGYLVVNNIIGVLMPLLTPAVQKEPVGYGSAAAGGARGKP